MSQNGEFVGIQFKMGLGENIQPINPNLVPSTHPLHLDRKMYNQELGNYIFNQIELSRTALMDSIPTIINIGDEYLKTIELPFAFTADVGFNITLTIRVDYRTWFEQINIKNDSPEDFVTKITENIAKSFQLVAVNKSVN
ncbi:MAG: hypothetical protein HC912_04680 [Saprospiraceae bacterium]|nr:hypothetical protein [Saprospiraceae bacterium]